MSWTCPYCGLTQTRWVLRCPIDGSLQFAPRMAEPEDRDKEWLLRATPVTPPRSGETVVFGVAVTEPPMSSAVERSPFRPARFAVLVAFLWLGAPLIWALLRPPSIAREIGLLLALAGAPMLLVYLIALRVSRNPSGPAAAAATGATSPASSTGVPGPIAAIGVVLESLARWIAATFPGQDKRPVIIFTLQRPMVQPVRVRLVRPTGWPVAAAPAQLRVVGRWDAEPERFAARAVEVLADGEGNWVRALARADRVRGWVWATAILLAAGVASGAWLTSVLTRYGF